MENQQTRVWPIDPLRPDPETILAAARLIQAGALVAFPTETVYGLGANALDPDAVQRIYLAKGRPAKNPIIVHVDGPERAQTLVTSWPETAELLATHFWPGPLTLVLPRNERVPDIVTGGGSTVAIRCPSHPVPLALIRAADVPIAAPSANRSSELSPTLPEHVLASLDGRIDALLEGGPTDAGIESTVVDLSGPVVRLLRPGPIALSQLEALLLGPIERGGGTSSSAGPLLSPGMLARHYAPHTPLECLDSLEQIRRRAAELAATGERVAILSTCEIAGALVAKLPADPKGYAAGLYRALHDLDRRGLDRILVLLPPEKDEWLAVRDRLQRAAATE